MKRRRGILNKFERIKKEIEEYWGFELLDKGTYFKSGYCVINTIRRTSWIYYRTLKIVEECYLSDDDETLKTFREKRKKIE